MKTYYRLAVAFVASLTLFLSGCSGPDNHDKVADDAMAQMEKLATAMSTVTDKASAEKAAKDIKGINEELKKIAVRGKALGKPSPEVAAKIEARMKAKQEEFQKKSEAGNAKMKDAGPEAGMVVMGAMMELMPTMQELEGVFKLEDKK